MRASVRLGWLVVRRLVACDNRRTENEEWTDKMSFGSAEKRAFGDVGDSWACGYRQANYVNPANPARETRIENRIGCVSWFSFYGWMFLEDGFDSALAPVIGLS